MLSGAKPAVAGYFILKTNQKRIPRYAPDDILGGFFVSILDFGFKIGLQPGIGPIRGNGMSTIALLLEPPQSYHHHQGKTAQIL
jgi:hypothetical protein